MATETTGSSSTTDTPQPNSDAYLGQPIDRKGKTLNDEQAAIFNRYNHWKSNLMCLYNHIESFALPYPARTMQFLPNPSSTLSAQNQYPRYTNCPFLYPSHCTVPKQDPSAQTTDPSAPHKASDSEPRAAKLTHIYLVHCMHYFAPDRLAEQQHLRQLDLNELDLSNIAGIRRSALQTGVLPYDAYMEGGAAVESAYDVYRLRVMPQQPHLIATRSNHEVIAIYWLDFDRMPRPLRAFDDIKAQSTFPERSGLSLSDDDDSDCDMDSSRTCKRAEKHDAHDPPTKRQKLKLRGDSDSDEEEDPVEVGAGHGYLVAVGQTSLKTKTGWALAFNAVRAGLLATGNSDGSILR